MPKTIYFAAATLDGFIADDDDGIEWLTAFEPNYDGEGEDVLPAISKFIEGVGALIMGSSTYEFILPHEWPYGDRPTWVLTSRDLPVAEGADIRFHDGPVADVHPEIVQAAGERDVWHVGGGGIASDLVEAGLLDELQLTVVPIILGSGKRLFDRPIPSAMRLQTTRPFSTGMYELHYSLAPRRGSSVG